jgi:hypothetical protein
MMFCALVGREQTLPFQVRAVNLPSATERRNIMNVTHRVITTAFTTAVVGILFVPAASACGPNLQSPFAIQQVMLNAQNPLESVTSAGLSRDLSNASSGNSPSIVGSVEFSVYLHGGNTTHNPSIRTEPSSTSDTTSGTAMEPKFSIPAGVPRRRRISVWVCGRKHFALNYDPATGTLLGKISVVETVTCLRAEQPIAAHLYIQYSIPRETRPTT